MSHCDLISCFAVNPRIMKTASLGFKIVASATLLALMLLLFPDVSEASLIEESKIEISAISNLLYDKDIILLARNTSYTLIFHNDIIEVHNLVVAIDMRIPTEDTLYDPNDLVIGPNPLDGIETSDYGAPGKSWSVKLTTPDNDTFLIFFCSIQGHFRTMRGYFVIGDPAGDPPIELNFDRAAAVQMVIAYLVGAMITYIGVLSLFFLSFRRRKMRIPKALWGISAAIIGILIFFLVLAVLV